MPKLSRLRFVSIGHPNARMQDLMINLSDQSGMPSDSTIWLRNGGGKSSILSLFFALPRPNRRDFLGSKADAKQRRIEDYILTNDRSVVAAEWVLDNQTLAGDDEAPELPRFLTGVFYEYAGGNRDSLRRLFFCARVSDAVKETLLPTLPTEMDTPDGGKVRRTMISFKHVWQELRDAHPSLQFYYTENQSEWSEKLQYAGIDPGLFGYQLIMNSREGGADELFRFNNPDDFVDFLLELTVEPSRADGITENLETFRKQLQRRKHEFLPDLNLSTGLIERLTPLVELHDRRIRTTEEAGRLLNLHAQLRASIALNTQQCLEDEKRHAAEIDALRARWHDAEARQIRDRGIACAVALRIAEQELKRAADQAAECAESVEQAQCDQILWQAAYPYREYVIAQNDAEEFKKMLSGANDRREPILDQLSETANAYIAAMRHQIQNLNAERGNIKKQCDEQEIAATELDAEAGKLEREAYAAESEATSYEKNLSARRNKFESLIKLEIIQDGETPAQALERIEAAQKTRRAKLRSIERSREGNAALQDDCARLIDDYQRSTAEHQAELKSLEREYQKANDARDRIEADREFLSLLELDSLDIDDAPDDTAAILVRRAAEYQECVARMRTEAAALERARVHIAERGLMPPSVEVESLLSYLGAKSNAKSGWSYIAENFAGTEDEKERIVRRFPEAAQGIIVPVSEFDRTCRLIESNPEAVPPIPIVIATPDIFSETAPESLSRRIVGPKDHAWFNTADARKTLETLEKKLDGIQADIRENDKQRDLCTNAANRFKIFRNQYPRGWFAAAKARIAQLRVRYEDDQARLEMQNDEKQRLIAAQRADDRDVTRLSNEILGQKSACERLSEFVSEIDSAATSWRQSADEKLAVSQELREQAESIRAKAREIRDKAREKIQSAEPIAARISLLENEISRVKYADTDIEPAQGPIEELKSRYARLLEQVEREYTDNEIARNLETAERAAKKDLQQVKHLIRGKLTVDDVRAAVEALANPNDIELNGERAEEMLAIETRRKDDAVKHQSMCEAALNQRKNAWMGAGKPAVPDNTAIEKETVDGFSRRADEAGEELRRIDADIKDRERAAAAARHIRENLAKDAERLSSVQRSHAQFLTPQQNALDFMPTLAPEDISPTISDFEQRLEKYKEAHDSLDTSRKSHVASIRKWVENPQFAELQNRLITQFKVLDPEALESSASEFRHSLNIRIRELTATLEEIEKHRNFLAKFLLNAADDGLRLIKLADSASTVPREVPDIGGSRFLRITTKEPASQTDRLELIQELVDSLIDETTLPTGTKLIQRAVRQIAHPFSVRVLNPDPASPQRLIEITETARFSGGEQLTCAILLYCTLANVRARTRGMNRQPTSVLILDNPIGRASRTVFINMQRQFAGAMGIQLIYTTAVNDLEALSILPNIVRLRNERTDLNRGHRLLEQDVDISGRLESIRIAKSEDSLTEADAEIDGEEAEADTENAAETEPGADSKESDE